MPELPEVETIRRAMAGIVVGRSVQKVDVLGRPPIEGSQQLNAGLAGTTINAVRRRGKLLVLDLNGGMHLLLHPMMTGQMVVVECGATAFAGGHPTRSMLGTMPDRTTRLVFSLTGNTGVFFNDQRKFGWIRLVDTAALQVDPFLARLGPEPLSVAFTVDGFRERLAAHRRAAIKPVLLDQSTVAGLGNIYADEALNLAGIDPRRLSGSLDPSESANLHAAISTTLGAAVDHGGTSFEDYVNSFRGSGNHLARARVFRRAGQPCPVCGTVVERIQLAGRGTNYCPQCQPSRSVMSAGPPTARRRRRVGLDPPGPCHGSASAPARCLRPSC